MALAPAQHSRCAGFRAGAAQWNAATGRIRIMHCQLASAAALVRRGRKQRGGTAGLTAAFDTATAPVVQQRMVDSTAGALATSRGKALLASRRISRLTRSDAAPSSPGRTGSTARRRSSKRAFWPEPGITSPHRGIGAGWKALNNQGQRGQQLSALTMSDPPAAAGAPGRISWIAVQTRSQPPVVTLLAGPPDQR